MAGCSVSEAYDKFKKNLVEIHRLRQEARRIEQEKPSDRTLLNALNRAATVLLCSRIETYVEEVFVEGWYAVEDSGTLVDHIPPELRVELFQRGVKNIASPSKNEDDDANEAETDEQDTGALARRDEKIRFFIEEYAYLWMSGQKFDARKCDVTLITRRLHNPNHKNVRGLFRHFGLNDIFITLESEVAQRRRAENLKRDLQDLVRKRHAIAHGNSDAKPTSEDIARYLSNALWLCRNLDAVVGLAIERITGTFPWKGNTAYSEVQVYQPLLGRWPTFDS